VQGIQSVEEYQQNTIRVQSECLYNTSCPLRQREEYLNLRNAIQSREEEEEEEEEEGKEKGN
jgi:hypothetical protein